IIQIVPMVVIIAAVAAKHAVVEEQMQLLLQKETALQNPRLLHNEFQWTMTPSLLANCQLTSTAIQLTNRRLRRLSAIILASGC
ncbi:hypothetical protein BJX63DRAFT_410943, partial [Aspergillus granulosus]